MALDAVELSMSDARAPGRLRQQGRRIRGHANVRFGQVRARWPVADRLARAEERYRRRNVEYASLVVVYRALFLAICVMLGVLYVLAYLTSLMPGVNEITIPTIDVPTDFDLGAAVQDALLRSRSTLLDVLGMLTLILSATYTAKALRQGSEQVLRPEAGRRIRTLHPGNLVAGMGLALVILLGWLLALATAVRTSAIAELLDAHLARPLVGVGKGVLVLASVALMTLAVFLPLRRIGRRYRTGELLVASAAFAAFTVGANFVLIYSYLGALIAPNTSSGVVLVLAILAWVNVVSRALFYVECWIVEGDR